MKKILSCLVLLAVLAVAGCNKHDEPTPAGHWSINGQEHTAVTIPGGGWAFQQFAFALPGDTTDDLIITFEHYPDVGNYSLLNFDALATRNIVAGEMNITLNKDGRRYHNYRTIGNAGNVYDSTRGRMFRASAIYLHDTANHADSIRLDMTVAISLGAPVRSVVLINQQAYNLTATGQGGSCNYGWAIGDEAGGILIVGFVNRPAVSTLLPFLGNCTKNSGVLIYTDAQKREYVANHATSFGQLETTVRNDGYDFKFDTVRLQSTLQGDTGTVLCTGMMTVPASIHPNYYIR